MRSITIPRITAITVLLLFAMWAHEPVLVADAAIPPPAAFTRGVETSKGTDFALLTVNDGAKEVARITANGRVYLNGKEIHTDPEYRAAMMALMRGAMGCQP
jgi:hypothetical protein